MFAVSCVLVAVAWETLRAVCCALFADCCDVWLWDVVCCLLTGTCCVLFDVECERCLRHA